MAGEKATWGPQSSTDDPHLQDRQRLGLVLLVLVQQVQRAGPISGLRCQSVSNMNRIRSSIRSSNKSSN